MSLAWMDADIDAMFAGEFGVDIESSGTITRGIFDSPDREVSVGGPSIDAKDPMVQIRTSALPDLKKGDLITVDGTPYKVRSTHAVQDGRVSHVSLQRVANG